MKLSTFLVSVSLIAALILFRAGMHVSREDAEIHSRPRRSSLLMGTPPSDRHLDPVLSGASQWQVPQVEPTTPATMPKMLRLQHTTRAPATAQPAPALRYAWEGVTHSGDERARCAPTPAPDAAPTRRLDYIVPATAAFPSNCDRPDDGIPELCAAVGRVAVRREVMVAVCDSNVITQLEVFLSATKKANITNVMVIALDRKLAGWLDAQDPPVAYWLRPDAAKGSHKISAQKFKFIGAVLSVGASALVTDIDVVYVQDPFRFFWRDSDVEGTTDGWDPATAYGWTEQNDDAPLGWARYSYAHRSTAWNSGLWFVQATAGGARLMALLAHRMATENTWDQTAFNEEVGLPARPSHSGAGVTRRAANFLCFANSKTLFRRVLRSPTLSSPSRHRIVVSHVNYHQPKPPKMRAVHALYHEGDDSLARAELSREPNALLNTTTLEEEAWLALNGGFVLGRTLGESSRAVREGCRPPPPMLGFTYPLHAVGGRAACDLPLPCALLAELRAGASAAAGAGAPAVVLVVAAAADAVVLDAFVAAAAAVEVGARSSSRRRTRWRSPPPATPSRRTARRASR